MQIVRRILPLVGLGAFALLLYQLYPSLLFQVMSWQKAFNLQLSGALNQIAENSLQAGLVLIAISFVYGVFHAVGPGHGKFVLTGYLSFEQTKLPQAVKITLISAIVQGLVAVILVSIIVVLFHLSRSYFNLTLQWIERISFLLMIFFGAYWSRKALKSLRPKKVKINTIRAGSMTFAKNSATLTACQTGSATMHAHTGDCNCGHKHMPSAHELQRATDWKTTATLILSIGLRPCSGAVLVLFLAYTLDIYLWGVAAALMMALGTGFTLSLFAILVLFARQKAVNAGRWYLSLAARTRVALLLKLLAGLLLIALGILFLHGTFLDSNPTMLFRR